MTALRKPSGEPGVIPVPLRTHLALVALRGAGAMSRALGLGSGSTVGGRIGLALQPELLRYLSQGREIAIVSGTNGKTTTTRFLAEALAGRSLGDGATGDGATASGRSTPPVASSTAGANMPAGIAAALAMAAPGVPGVLEVDEAYVPTVIEATAPKVVVLLNLSRDQLDRVSEVRMLAARWAAALEGFGGTVVANADDPLVVWAASKAPNVVHVAVGGIWRADAYHCPVCDARIVFPADPGLPGEPPGDAGPAGAGWKCSSCGFTRPDPQSVLDGMLLRVAGGTGIPVDLAVPGRFNRANAAIAAIAAQAMGVDVREALESIGTVSEIAGRFATVHHRGVEARLLLAKNPAGWSELVDLLRGSSDPLVVAINARIADGHDPSWLWDVPFEELAGRPVVASGDRRRDLAVRLLHAGVEHRVVGDTLEALAVAAEGRSGAPLAGPPGATVDFVGNYTAFQDVRRRCRGGGGVTGRAGAGTPAPGRSAPGRSVAGRSVAGRSVAGRSVAGRSVPGESALRVVVVHPDLLGTYGDGGNGRVLANRARWRGFPVELVHAPSDRALPGSADLYCLGGGEDGPQARAAEVLRAGTLARAVEHGAVVLGVCAGFQILGESFPGAPDAGTGPGHVEHLGVGLIDARTIRVHAPRAVGEVIADPLLPTDPRSGLDHHGTLTGFENHAGRTVLGEGLRPLARVRIGTGNDGEGGEGAVSGKVIGTYLHGPVLARNPWLADHLLGLALGIELGALDDTEEEALRAERLGAAERQFTSRQGGALRWPWTTRPGS